jgi:hypothetical protein
MFAQNEHVAVVEEPRYDAFEYTEDNRLLDSPRAGARRRVPRRMSQAESLCRRAPHPTRSGSMRAASPSDGEAADQLLFLAS